MKNQSARAFRLSLLSAAAVLSAPFWSAPARAGSCEDLVNLKLPDTTISTAESIPGGDYTSSDKRTWHALPPFCRVLASVKGAPDSDIRIEMWLPKDGWKRVFHGNGSGGYGGVFALGYDGLAAGVKRGYASAATDMGMAPATPLDGDAIVGHPQKWKDWGLTSTHVMTETGKAIAKAFYGEDTRHAYYTGCSTGGQEGIIEAQYYPDDYDGILIGAPVVSRTWGHAAVVWDYMAANLQPGHKLSDAKLTLLTKSAVAACGANENGLKSDPFIADPAECKFDPAALTCKGDDSPDCLTPAEVETAKAFYSGPTDPKTGAQLYYGWPAGSEAGGFNWGFLQAPVNNPNEPSFDGLFKWVFGADWNWRTFNFGADMQKVDATLGPMVNGATTGEVGTFKARGGKMVIFQGWADPIVSPFQTVDFYKRLAKQAGGPQGVAEFARLFMVPGVGHCGGGAGPNSFSAAVYRAPETAAADASHDMFAALSRWVEDGVAPEQAIATKYVGDDPAKGIAMQRPLCPYPQKAWYKGAGDTNSADSFMCAEHK